MNEDQKNKKPLEELIPQVKEAYSADLNYAQEREDHLIENRDKIMNNLVVSSGALATGSLVLISSKITVNRPYILFGIVILLFLIGFVFLFQFYQHRKETRNFSQFTKRKIAPVASLIVLYAEYQLGRGNLEDVNKKIIEVAKKLKEYEIENNDRISNLEVENPNQNYWDWFFVTLMVVGFGLIIFGLLSPYFIC
jgi:uncharacterized membrane protein